MRRWMLVPATMASLLWLETAEASPVTIDPGAYDGVFSIVSAPGQRSGVTTLDLAPGPHLLIVGPDGAYVPLTVGSDGSVTTSNTGAATTSGSTVTLQTATVVIDPGLYEGRFFSANRLSVPRTGPTSLTLVRNLVSYVALGGVGTGSDVVFRVEANGEVTVVSPAGSATASANTLFIETEPVTFDPQAYAGDYFVHFDGVARRGVTTVDLPRRVLDYVEVAGRGIGATIGFRVDTAGAVTVLSPTAAALGGDRLVTFENVQVTFDPSAYSGTYSLAGRDELNLSGPTSFTLVPGVRSYVQVGTRGAGALAAFSINPTGLQMITPNVATTDGYDLTFLTRDIVVSPQGHSNTWTPLGYAAGSGVRQITVVPSLPMYVQVGPTARAYVVSSGESCAITPATLTVGSSGFDLVCAAPPDLDADGDGIPDDQDVCPLGDDLIDTDGDLSADACDVCPLDFFNDSDGDGSCDSGDVCPLDELDDADGDGLCADADPCPSDPDDDLDGDGICGDLDVCPEDASNDADGDGVCGASDECPGGDDADDSDEDGVPDACDLCAFDPANDADADGLCADEDVCPLDADDDADGDGTCANEDVCPLDADDDADGDGMCANTDPCPVDPENDADGDGVCEVSDNCPTQANANQSDADGDGFGDVCETDGDGDGVADDLDNCPLDANASQTDADSDHIGDVCDLDDDNDGVVDGSDTCLATPPGKPVLNNGCSVAQECQCNAQWKNHGAYVKCVTHAAGKLVVAGKLSACQSVTVVAAAAQSKCGKR